MAPGSLRPSGAPRWVPCPPSARLEAEFPDDDGEDAKQGKAAHWASAQVLTGEVSAIEELTDRQAPNGVMLDGEMVEAAEMYIEAVGRGKHAGTYVEKMVPSYINGIDDHTPDCFIIQKPHGWIYDFKFGWRIVEPWSWQLIIYAVNLFIIHNWELETITTVVVQPRPYHVDGRIRHCVITRQQAVDYFEEIEKAVSDVANPHALCQTGPHCHDCKALHVCEAARRATLNAVDLAYKSTPVNLSDAELGAELSMLRRAAEAIDLRKKAMEANGMARIDNGGVIPGWSVDRAVGHRRWKNGVSALEAMTGHKLTENKEITPAAAEKLGIAKNLVNMFTTTPETKRKLIPRDSSVKAKEVFK